MEAMEPAALAGVAPPSGTAARQVASYAAVVLGCLLLAPWVVRSGWVGNVHIHMLHEAVAVLLALGVAAIALVRFHSRKSDTFLLLGTAFAGTAFLDAYHALATSAFFAERFQASDLASTSPWSWLASRLFLAVFLWMNAPTGRRPSAEARLDERTVYLLVGAVTLACFAFFTFTPLPSAYFPHLLVRRPAELIPAIFFLLAIVRHLRWGNWRQEGFEHWMMMALLFGLMGQIAFMPFASRPFDAASEAGHMAKNLSYACVLTGLLGSMYSLFRRADESAAELARINAALQAEIDERARAEEERDRFFDMSVEMLCVAGFDGWFKHLNPSWEKVLGWTAAELMSRPFTEFVHPDDRTPTSSERQRLSAGEVTVDFENRYLTKEGTYRWLSWRSVAVEEQGLIYAVARDVEEQKRIEQLKNDFVSVVSHELRTPLTSIRGSLGLIAGGVAGELPAKVRSLVDIAAKNCERLVRLINDILDVEKIESGQMGFRLAPVDLAALAEQAIESNRAYAEGYGVELRIVTAGEAAGGARVWGDADRLLQVITNLISNAVKFSPRGGVVEVAVTRGEGEARVAVTDHGPGVPPEFRQRIFEKFAQADSSSTREKGGTGLGLSISRAIVERHQGRIGFASEPGVATTFFFDLPLFGPPNGGAPGVVDWLAKTIDEGRLRAAMQQAVRLSGARILHVEDDPDLQQVVAAIVDRDATVEQALDLATARERLAGQRFDLVILDLYLPDGSGLELLPFLSSLDPATPVLIFSAHEVDAAVADRVASVLIKSQTSNRELLERIRSALGGGRAPAGGEEGRRPPPPPGESPPR